MAASNIESELKAVKAITSELTALDTDARGRVLDYVFKFLGLSSGFPSQAGKTVVSPADSLSETVRAAVASGVSTQIRDIRSLKDEKTPRSANEMATIVAFYLSELAPEEERRDSIGVADVQKYFKQAGYPLPQKPSNTLSNAAAAGYFDSIGHGQYRLNPVGYNLVAHNLPASSSERPKKTTASGKSKKKSSSPKKVANNKKRASASSSKNN